MHVVTKYLPKSLLSLMLQVRIDKWTNFEDRGNFSVQFSHSGFAHLLFLFPVIFDNIFLFSTGKSAFGKLLFTFFLCSPFKYTVISQICTIIYLHTSGV